MMRRPGNLAYIRHIKDSVQKIKEFTQGVSYKEFVENDMIVSAVIRKLEIIGEATNKVSRKTKDSYPDFPWRTLTKMRNFLIHEYFGVDVEAVWDTVQENIPELEREIALILADFLEANGKQEQNPF